MEVSDITHQVFYEDPRKVLKRWQRSLVTRVSVNGGISIERELMIKHTMKNDSNILADIEIIQSRL